MAWRRYENYGLAISLVHEQARNLISTSAKQNLKSSTKLQHQPCRTFGPKHSADQILCKVTANISNTTAYKASANLRTDIG